MRMRAEWQMASEVVYVCQFGCFHPISKLHQGPLTLFRCQRMPNYKLTYFDGQARGEVCRLILVHANQPFEDVRVPGDTEEWPKLKPTMPFLQMPVLDVDGVRIAQSNAIARLLAKRFGLTGKTDIEDSQIDMIVDATEDMVRPVITYRFEEEDPTRKEEMKKKFATETFPQYMTNIQKILVANKGGDGYLVGDKLTLADIHATFWMGWVDDGDMTPYPKLLALKARVEAEPAIAKWIKARLVTEF